MKNWVIGLIVLIVVLLVALLAGTNSFTGKATYGYVEKKGFTCKDTDGDMKIYDSLFVKGTATRVVTSARGDTSIYEDKCVGSRKVIEYYCDSGGFVKSERRRCPRSCIDGACIKN